jgi:hypothetical protein
LTALAGFLLLLAGVLPATLLSGLLLTRGLLILLAGVLPATLLSGLLLARGLLILLAGLVLLAWLVVLIRIIHGGYLIVKLQLDTSNYEHLDYNRQIAVRMSSIDHKEAAINQAFRTSPWRTERRQKEG